MPQGSHLGPLLFNLFINDLPTCLNCSSVLLYADDAKIYKNIVSTIDAEQLQLDINSFIEWCGINLLNLNYKKCSVISFTRENAISYEYTMGPEQLKRVNTVKDLGVLLDSKLY